MNVVPEEERSHGTISNKTYLQYVQEGGNTILTIIFIVIFITAEVCSYNALMKVELITCLSHGCHCRVELSVQTGGYQNGMHTISPFLSV